MKKKTKQDPTKVVGETFDANGHRVKRNPETNRRKRGPVNLQSVDKTSFSVYWPIELVAKMKQYIIGKRIDAIPLKGRTMRVKTRPMTVAALLQEFATALTKDLVLSPDSLAWVNKVRKANVEKRKQQEAMIAAGINRIPKDQQMKRGRGAESYKKAMAAKNK